ncbi:MAG: DUF1016 family protein [Nitrospinae bacterium]|nr:DUF1016 family protein [Nitrospinota bacterium]
MIQKFRNWLINRGNLGAAQSYPGAINRISTHYSENTGEITDIYSLRDIDAVNEIARKYRQDGIYSNYGYEGNGLYRNAIARYSEFLTDYFAGNDLSEEILPPTENENVMCNNFTYEKDLKFSLCNQISTLFPGYKIFGENKEGIEYSIEGKRIDVLLENITSGSLLAIELKSGVADFRVFGQIAMYLGLLKKQFPDRKSEGVIISGEVDESLRNACLITEAVSLKTYRMTLNLENA